MNNLTTLIKRYAQTILTINVLFVPNARGLA